MKCHIGLQLLVASLMLSSCLALPAGSPSDDAEVIDVPRRGVAVGGSVGVGAVGEAGADGDKDFKNFKGVIDTGVGYPFLQPNPLPFSLNFGFFDSFEDIFRRLRTRLWPVELPTDSSEDVNILSSFDPAKGNTTSTVKIVDGHKVEVNETVYGDGNNLFKVRVVNIRPVDSDESVDDTDINKTGNPVTTKPSAGANGEDAVESNERREPLESKSEENEIKRNIDDPEQKQEALAQTQALEEAPAEAEERKAEEVEATTIVSTMLPPSNDEANLNAAFVTDNSLTQSNNGSSDEEEVTAEVVEIDGGAREAETNTSEDEMDANHDASVSNAHEERENDDEEETEEEEQATTTIENNEETEVNDNFNESSDETTTAATDLTKDMSALELAEENDAVEDAEELVAELSDDDDENNVAAAQTTEVIAAAALDMADAIEASDMNPNEKRYANYKQREDISSSDDEDEAVEMSAEFNSEWGGLAEQLANTNDRENNLSNDIDAYEAVPIDLSNDIAVNDLAASNPNFPHNPDAEFIDVMAVRAGDMPKFEKLSMSTAMEPTSYQAESQAANMK